MRNFRPDRAAVWFWLLGPTVLAGAQGMATARAEAKAGRVDTAVAAAKAAAAADSHSPQPRELLCSLYRSIELRDQAVAECEAAALLAPTSSTDALELARAYGEKAEHSGALTGMRMVGKIRTNFEKAVALDGRSVDALSDLGEFYVSAPGVAGGGVDKAKSLVPRLSSLTPARGHRLQAMIDEKEKNDSGAFAEYNAEILVAHEPEAYFSLAGLYRDHKDLEKAAAYARLTLEADKNHGPDTLDAAGLLLDTKRELSAAETGLRAYLAAPQTGVAQYARAHLLLGRCLRATGDSGGAKKEFAAALALAHEYEAARKAANG